MRYSFSGHESFFCKALWLKKGVDFVQGGRRFADPDAGLRLGVGKNMVAAIRYWLRAFGLTEGDRLTPLAIKTFADGGTDPYIEDTATLWTLHYRLVAAGVASLYRLTFVEFQRERREFDRDQLQLFVKRKCAVPEQKNAYNENTVRKDIRVLLQNYVAPTAPKSMEEYAGVLIGLGLLRQSGDLYAFAEVAEGQVPDSVLMAALRDTAGQDKTVSLDQLQDLALTFCMPTGQFLAAMQHLAQRHADEIAYSDTSGVRNVQFLN